MMERKDAKEKMFRGVPPGISLTKEPGSYPWERPPQMEDPEEVITFYLERMSQPENLEKMMMLIDTEFPIRAFVEGTLTAGVSRGLHTIDMSMIAAPILHEFVKGMADAAGIEYDEGLEDKAKKEKMDKMYSRIRLQKELEKVKKNKQSSQTEDVSEEIFEETPIELEKEEPKGLMARKGGV